MAAKDIVGGIDGAVSADGFNGDIDGWAFNTQVNEVTWRTFASKLLKRANVSYGFTGSFTGTIQLDDTDTAPQPATTGGSLDPTSFEGVSLTLTAATGCTYTGTANITGVALSRPSDNRMTGTWNFAFTEIPTQTWDETGS